MQAGFTASYLGRSFNPLAHSTHGELQTFHLAGETALTPGFLHKEPFNFLVWNQAKVWYSRNDSQT